MRYSEEELLKIVGEERKRSIGFGEGDTGELSADRERALQYYRGDVSKDIPTVDNRSRVVSTDVAEAIETALPDLIEIFIGGDDIATFQPNSQTDEQQAREESDYVRHVIFSENEGFLTFNTAFKDALLCKTGLFHWWREEEETEEEVASVLPEIAAVAEAQGLTVDEAGEDGLAPVRQRRQKIKVCVRAVPPEDFSVAADTVSLKDAAYCVMRERPRVQDLIERGVDPEVARGLKSYAQPNQTVSLARDSAGEQTLEIGDATGDLRQVEVRAHYIRLAYESEELAVWKVVTDSEETLLIGEPEKCERVPFGALTPYMNSHRFHGESVADKLLEVQRIKTTLWRMHLDSGYFALNQRNTVNMTLANEFTISDLLNNVPNMPVRTNGEGAVVPLHSGGLAFDALASIEYASTVGEARTGIVRNAQGLNPDTLHDTAKGAIALITAAQKRLRYIARVFAETGVRDLFLGVHALLRDGYAGEAPKGVERAKPHVKMGQEWKDVDPSGWQERTAVDVQVGVGSAGREHDLMVMGQILEMQERMAMGGLAGVLIKPENIYNAAKRFAQAANLKTPELYFSDPAQAEPQPPKPDPEAMKVELEAKKAESQLKLKAQEGQANLQMKAQEGQMNAQLAEQQAIRDHQLKQMQLEGELQLKREQLAAELQLKREQLTAELELKRELGFAQAQVAHATGMAKVEASTGTSPVRPGGEGG